MIYTVLTKKAMKLCFKVHKKQVDKSGLPYVFHPYHLAEQMDDETSTVCALLHDVIEDSDYTYDDLAEMGFTAEIIDVLKLLTHDKGTPYQDYIKKISENQVAKKVKIADLTHNSDLTRLNNVDDAVLERIKKYKRAIKFLKNSWIWIFFTNSYNLNL